MSLEKMNNMEELPQNENNNEPISLNENYLYTRNILHIIINTIINFALLITIIIEFIIRVNNNYPITNFDISAFILFEILFICLNYFKFDIKYLKGMIFYLFITCFCLNFAYAFEVFPKSKAFPSSTVIFSIFCPLFCDRTIYCLYNLLRHHPDKPGTYSLFSIPYY